MSAPHEDRGTQQVLVGGLVILGVVARLVPHPANVTPLTAIALFGGTYLSRRWAILLPLASVVISDLFLGLHGLMAWTWGSFVLAGLLGWWVRQQPRANRVATAALVSSTLFYLITNFGVWLVGDGGMRYPHTLQGLVSCYGAALPFYRNAVFGDLTYTFALFQLYAWAVKALPRPHAAH